MTFNAPAAGSAQDAVHIAFGTDRNYMPAMGVTVLSIVAHNPERVFVFHILVAALLADDLQILEKLALQAKVTLRIHTLDQECFSKIPEAKAATHAAYYRLFLGELLRGEAETVLYLDCDIVCMRALPVLPDMGSAIAAVVLDVAQKDRNAAIGRSESLPYFNSGVMVINLKAWNEHQVADKVIGVLSSGQKFRFPDQDALNLVLADHLIVLDQKWNRLRDTYRPDAAHDDTIFLHYAGEKPWLRWSPLFLDPPFAAPFVQSPWPARRLLTPRTRKHKGQYARHLFKQGRVPQALGWYMKFLFASRRMAA